MYKASKWLTIKFHKLLHMFLTSFSCQVKEQLIFNSNHRERKKLWRVDLIRAHSYSFNSPVRCLAWSHCPAQCKALFPLQFFHLLRVTLTLTGPGFSLLVSLYPFLSRRLSSLIRRQLLYFSGSPNVSATLNNAFL